jgi:hypothetical protein
MPEAPWQAMKKHHCSIVSAFKVQWKKPENTAQTLAVSNRVS